MFFVTAIIFFSLLSVTAKASPADMIKDGTYVVEYYQLIAYRGTPVFDNRDYAVLWPDIVYAVIKLYGESNRYLIAIGFLPNSDRPWANPDEDIANFIENVLPGNTVSIKGEPSLVGPNGRIYEKEFKIGDSRFYLDEPFYADIVRWSVDSRRSEALFLLPDTLEWPFYLKDPRPRK